MKKCLCFTFSCAFMLVMAQGYSVSAKDQDNVGVVEGRIVNLKDPITPQDAATKNYVDASIDMVPELPEVLQDTGQSTTAVMSQKAVSDAISNVNGTILNAKDIFNMIYPVGSIYISISSISPSTLFGGTWERFGKGRTIVSVDENNSRSEIRQANSTFGEEQHQISINEMPQHSHSWAFNDDNQESKDKKDCLGYVGWLEKWRWISSGINDAGGNQSMSMYQPSITCYVWLRTA